MKCRTQRWSAVTVLAVITVLATVSGCSSNGAGGSGGGNEQGDPTVPPVDDYTTLFESQGLAVARDRRALMTRR